ncbi:hypothetical protein DMB92_00275 [Campylobacter sp. MIT 99-7217]|uniref:hypothetical protein n=1 Tax=Campylobacter sp. MIT 99-7217 TaxID=535091 RepID=UPI00115B56D3|nr:hypothetical protein [Campylobacter sp. MIT 99-7217]TQR34438.1 hypothetical protein DMB92_00275 [Campylobacter sp. MIT 99-7217]
MNAVNLNKTDISNYQNLKPINSNAISQKLNHAQKDNSSFLDKDSLDKLINTLSKIYLPQISQEDSLELSSFMLKNQLKDPNKIEKSSFKEILDDTTQWMGIAREQSKLQTYLYYASSFSLGNDISTKALALKNEFEELLEQDFNLEDFKEKYLDFKQRHDEFVKEFELAMGDNLLVKPLDQYKTPTPIQAKSSNQTYKDKPTNEFLQKLLKDKFEESDLLELLFEDKTYKQSFKNIFKNENLNLALQFLQVDIKA